MYEQNSCVAKMSSGTKFVFTCTTDSSLSAALGMRIARVCQGVRGGCHSLGLVMEPILVGHEILRYAAEQLAQLMHRSSCSAVLAAVAKGDV